MWRGGRSWKQNKPPESGDTHLLLEAACPNPPHWPGLTLATNRKDKSGLQNVSPSLFFGALPGGILVWITGICWREGPLLSPGVFPPRAWPASDVVVVTNLWHQNASPWEPLWQMKNCRSPGSKRETQQKETQMKFMSLLQEPTSLLAWGHHSQQDSQCLSFAPRGSGWD